MDGEMEDVVEDVMEDVVEDVMEDVMEDVVEDVVEEHAPHSLPILSLIHTQRYQNGLRYNDHFRYRSYCARRLRRLHVVLKFKYGKGRYKRTLFPEDFTDPKFLEILLVNADRSWAYAMQLKADSASAQQPNARWRKHSISRLAKAKQWSSQLNTVAEKHCDTRTQQEARAYDLYMQAIWRLEREEHKDALEALNSAKVLYERLGTSVDVPSQQAYKDVVREMEPLFRLAKYNLGIFDDNEQLESECSEGDVPEGAKVIASKTTIPPGVEAKPLLIDLAFANLKPPDVSHLVQKTGFVSKVTGALSWGSWLKR